VKASDWTDLCYREHEQGGEVIAVSLTRQSMQELAGDVLGAASLGVISFTDPDGHALDGPPAGTCGGRIGNLFNEADGGREVDFTPLAEADTVTVRDADGSVRTIAFVTA
jgi:hypothetical protein